MKSFTFRQYRRLSKQDPKDSASDSKEKESAAYLKRREQVRRAQRTHRERKENYVKQLENEVLQLRTNEARILQENRNQARELARLRQILERNGISSGGDQSSFYPTQLSESSSPGPLSASSISILENPQHQHQLHILGSQGSGGSAQFYLTESEASPPGNLGAPALRPKRSFFRRRGRSESQSNDESSASGQAPPTDLSAIAQSTSNLSLGEMNQTDLGMEFVLTLEQPCLHHIQGSPTEPHAPTGHALTASAPLLYQSPTQPVDTTPTSSHSHAHAQWDTPHIGLEKLLSLSSNFELTDEITPVQAWNQIRSHPDFQNVDVNGLRRLTGDMLKHMKCYGFGAVIDTEVFEECARGVFPRGGVFGFEFGNFQ